MLKREAFNSTVCSQSYWTETIYFSWRKHKLLSCLKRSGINSLTFPALLLCNLARMCLNLLHPVLGNTGTHCAGGSRVTTVWRSSELVTPVFTHASTTSVEIPVEPLFKVGSPAFSLQSVSFSHYCVWSQTQNGGFQRSVNKTSALTKRTTITASRLYPSAHRVKCLSRLI